MKARIVGFVASALLSLTAVARADPVLPRQITGGQVETNTVAGQFAISGSGFDLTGRFDNFPAACQPCKAGETRTFAALTELRTPMSGTVDGVTYPSLFVGNAFFGDPGIFRLFGSPVTIPLNAQDGTVVSFPFTTAPGTHLVGYVDRPPSPKAFDIALSGSGTASVPLHLDGFLSDGTPFFTGTNVTWRFEATDVAPTPEPASIALVGLACLGLAGRRVLRRPH